MVSHSSHSTQVVDRLARLFGTRSSRRQALGQIGKVGGAGVATAVGAGSFRSAAAQSDDTGSCSLTVQGMVATGDERGTTFNATIDLTLDGSVIDEGSFTVTDVSADPLPGLEAGSSYPLVGSSDGRGLHLRIALSDDRFLTLEGTAQFDVALCRGDAAGTFGGPMAGMLGTWTTMADGTNADGGTEPVVTETETPDDNPGDTTDSGDSTETPPEPTAEPEVCEPIDCGVTLVFDEMLCDCVCPGNNIACGPLCCPGGSVCMDEASGMCGCPDGTELCGDLCVESCMDGYELDYNICGCVEVAP